jgi:hypothetical protein
MRFDGRASMDQSESTPPVKNQNQSSGIPPSSHPMKLPNAELAIVPERKVTLYLLNRAHPIGGAKAIFFLHHGFALEQWQVLAEGLLQHAVENDVVASDENPHGVRYAVDGPLVAPTGKSLNIRTAWFMDRGSGMPRFITAHPLPKT